MRASDLARELGIEYRTLRGWLARSYPRASGDLYAAWELNSEQVGAVRGRFGDDHDSTLRTAAGPPPGGQPATRARPWYWEGNVVAALARGLAEEGWEIHRMANTETREQGVDLIARRDGRELVVEVKGYPTTTYERGPKAGQTKPTVPNNQARQWYSHALLSCLLLRDRYPSAEVAIAFPEMATYRRLIDRTAPSLERLGVGVYLIDESGVCRTHIAPTPAT